MNLKRQIIGVVGSSVPSQHGLDLAYQVGKLIAEAGAVLVTGGLGGVMEEASRGCADAGGLEEASAAKRSAGQTNNLCCLGGQWALGHLSFSLVGCAGRIVDMK